MRGRCIVLEEEAGGKEGLFQESLEGDYWGSNPLLSCYCRSRVLGFHMV